MSPFSNSHAIRTQPSLLRLTCHSHKQSAFSEARARSRPGWRADRAVGRGRALGPGLCPDKRKIDACEEKMHKHAHQEKGAGGAGRGVGGGERVLLKRGTEDLIQGNPDRTMCSLSQPSEKLETVAPLASDPQPRAIRGQFVWLYPAAATMPSSSCPSGGRARLVGRETSRDSDSHELKIRVLI